MIKPGDFEGPGSAWGAGDRHPLAIHHGIALIWLWLVTSPVMRLWRRMRHVHELSPSAVSYGPVGMFAALGAANPVTFVLLRCECGHGPGHLSSITLTGRWTLPQLLGEPEQEPANQVVPASLALPSALNA